jgi:2-methylcitrate dehydratase PrpD
VDHAFGNPAGSASYAQRLGAYTAGLQYEQLPPDYLARLGALLLYGLTVSLAYHGDDDATQRAMPLLHDAPGPCSLLMTGERRAPAAATAINAARVTARSQTDTHTASGGHIGCIVIPAVLAIAQERNASPRDTVAALAAAYEIPTRIGQGAVAASMQRGFRGTPVYGVLGAAAGAARALGLDGGRTAHALSLAANLAGGLQQGYDEGTPESIVHVAEASRSGLVAAQMAERGIIAADHTFEGRKGFYRAFADAVPEIRFDGWMLPRTVIKPTPGCIINQKPVQVLTRMMQEDGLTADNVESIFVHMNPVAVSYPGIDGHGPFPTRVGAIMSAAFMLRVVLEDGAVRMRDLLERHGPGPIHERSRMIQAVGDPAITERYGCRIEARLRDGRVLNRASTAPGETGFDIDELRRLCASIAREWPIAQPSPAFERLREAVDALVAAHRPDALRALFEATTLRPA